MPSPVEMFENRHIGPRPEDIETMLETIGCSSLDELIDQTVPASIRMESGLDLGEPISEAEVLERAETLGSENRVFFLGLILVAEPEGNPAAVQLLASF